MLRDGVTGDWLVSPDWDILFSLRFSFTDMADKNKDWHVHGP